MRLQDKSRREELSQEILLLKEELKVKGEELRKVKSIAEIIVD